MHIACLVLDGIDTVGRSNHAQARYVLYVETTQWITTGPEFNTI